MGTTDFKAVFRAQAPLPLFMFYATATLAVHGDQFTHFKHLFGWKGDERGV